MSAAVQTASRVRAPGTPTTFRPELHGVRGLAIALVVAFHIFGQGRVSGGIDAFLTVSGFLMTLSLARQIEAGTLTLGGYLARLARRLLPAALVVLGAAGLAGYIWTPPAQRAQLLSELRATLLYRENWELIGSQLDYAAAGPGTSPLQHFWSLSVQGQFYLVWFLLLVSSAWIGRRLLRQSVRSSVLVAVIVATAASFAFHQGWAAQDQQVAYFHTGSRIWELGLGGLVALLLPQLQAPRAARIAVGWLGVALLVSCGFVLDGGALFPGPWALWPVGGVLLVLMAGTTDHPASADRMLRRTTFRFLADVSYAWYLWHWPLLIFTLLALGQPRADLPTAAAIVAASLLLAWLTTRLVELPVGRLLAGRTSTTLAAAAVLVGVAVATTTATLDAVEEHRRAQLLAASRPSPDHPGAAALDPEFAGVLADVDPVPDVDVAAEDRPEVYRLDTCVNTHRDVPESAEPRLCRFGPEDAEHTVMVLGGSHVGQWMPALDLIAERQGWHLIYAEKGGCQFLDRPRPRSPDPVQTESCYAYNENLWPLIEQERPDYVFTIGTTSRAVTGETTPEGFVRYWQRLDNLGIGVLAMRDTTRLEEHVPECLARTDLDLRRCGTGRTWRLADESPIRRVTDLPDNVRPMEVTEYICGRDQCPPVQGNVVVYRDTSHITATYMRSLTPYVEQELRRVAPDLF